MEGIQSVRFRAAKFCHDRDWSKFHIPSNLVLALAGECGEVCEIFQWKGSLDDIESIELINNKFSRSEIINIGEEIADVFIYSTRLSDICDIDLAFSMRKVLDPEQYHPEYKRSQRESSWDDFNFLEMDQKLANNPNYDMNKNKAYRSPRRIALCIQSRIGLISDLFLSRPESESAVGLPQWSESEVSRLSSSLAIMCVLLACLARATNRNLGQVIKDKMEKNERKYPADRSRGSSAKYTAYQARPQLIPSLPSLILIVSSALLGYFLGRRR